MSAVDDLMLRLHLRAAMRSADVSFGDGAPRFAGACCDDCKKTGGSCGGEPKFGYASPAPAPPTVGWPFSDADLKSYAAYIDGRVQAMDQSWSAWHDAAQWDNGGAGCTPEQVAALQQQIAAGQITVSDAARQCHAEYYGQMAKADAWSSQILGDPAWTTWPMWSASFHDFARKISEGGVGQWILVNTVQGGVWGDYPTLKQKHSDLIRYAKLAEQTGLQRVADPGAVAVPSSAAQQAKQAAHDVGDVAGQTVGGLASGLTESIGGLILLAGGVYIGVKLLAGRRR